MSEHIYSVSQLNQTVRVMLENQLGQVWLTGEISNFTQPVSGHWYLTLKDENAQVRCAMFRMKNMRVSSVHKMACKCWCAPVSVYMNLVAIIS